MLSPEHLEPHLQRDHLLHGVVVDVVGDPGALFLRDSHDVFQEPLPLLVDLFEVPDDVSQLLGSLGRPWPRAPRCVLEAEARALGWFGAVIRAPP